MDYVLSNCRDFQNEITALQAKLAARGHILKMCVKCHPELAGCGVEYSWGKSKIHFRRHNDCVAKHLFKNVLDALHASVLSLANAMKFARKARNYREAYKVGVSSHVEVEQLYKVHKCHCSAPGIKFMREA